MKVTVDAAILKFIFQEPTFRPFRSLYHVQTVKPHISISSYWYLEISNCNQVRSLRTYSLQPACGEFRMILGPMLAGKKTTLLNTIRPDTSTGSFQGDILKNLYGWDKTLKELCFSGRVREAVGILCRNGLRVESETYSLLLQECIFTKAYKQGRRIHSQMVVVGFLPNQYLTIKLLILYAKSGDMDTAHNIFDRLNFKCLISWNAMIAGYVEYRMEEVGLCLYYKMKQHGLNPDQYTFSSVFRACASLSILEQGKQAHAMVIKRKICRNLVVNSALMDMYFKCSSPYDGYLVFEKSLEKNVITWTALISGFGQHGRVVEVLESYHRMVSEGFRPNTVTFLAVLSSCSHGGLVDEGREYFSSMTRDYGLQPSGKHYSAMVDLFGRAGRLEEAYEFIKNSPYQDHPVLWGALLGACKIHGNMDMLKLAAMNFFELEPENAGKYVVLSNAYASFGLWNNVAEVRRVMKESGVKKETGHSMIEVQRQAHFFSMGHNTHAQTDLIFEVIRDLTYILKDTGDVPELRS
ncbi:unnamed protein product [Cuscuta epithymum]|uniref:Pentatricopeptide repeat-containing protein n=2 Tax=Cuscuta epithymum TaxID=186058 RepID=A0AAV0E4X7_9ASTE|nr:unnamed protein product [Cuscuta epithymum]CAH9137844.1 unnamed protein product [Cuscuta epithymum]